MTIQERKGMTKIVIGLIPFLLLYLSSCEKNPSSPSPGDYELTTKVYTGSLTGNELLFYPTDAWMRYAGIYCADADGQNVRCLASYDPYFSVLVGDIVGNTIQHVKPIFQSKIESKKVSGGTAIYCLIWNLYN